MNLVPEDDSMVHLPTEIADTSLTLQEIGALVCFIGIVKGGKPGSDRLIDPEFVTTIKALKDKGIVEASGQGNKVTIKVDLTPLGI